MPIVVSSQSDTTALAPGANGTFWIKDVAFQPRDDQGTETYVLITKGADLGTAEVRDQDATNPVADGQRFGRDFLSGPTYQFTVLVKPSDGDVEGAVNRLANIWHDETLRTNPGAVTPLYFQRGGKRYVVFGRPRKFAEEAGDRDTFADGYTIVDCDFKTESPLRGIATVRSASMGLLQPTSDGGLTLPADVPFMLAPGTQQTREGSFTVGGTARTPFVLTITGPVTGALTGAAVKGNGWSLALSRPLLAGQKLVIDTRLQTALLNGVSSPGILTARSRLSGKLSPGPQTMSFTGTDGSATARVELRWYDSVTA